MQLTRLAAFLAARLIPAYEHRTPDFIVGGDNPDGAYLHRWYLTPWRRAQTRWRKKAKDNPTWRNRTAAWWLNKLPNLYLHRFLRDDDDRALHDHPSAAVSLILRTGYIEHTIRDGGIHYREVVRPGRLRYLGLHHAHRIELHKQVRPSFMSPATSARAWMKPPRAECWSLFMFGPMLREWGFHCPKQGWVHWAKFTAADKPGEVGPGCEAD